MRWRCILFVLCIFVGSGNIFAEEIYLNNGDRISGKVVGETAATVIVETQAMGRISVNKDFIEQAEKTRAEDTPREYTPQWQRKVSIGYSQTGEIQNPARDPVN